VVTTNPYASPATTFDAVDCSEQEIRSVIRTFRILATFALAQGGLVCFSLTRSMILYGGVSIQIVGVCLVQVAMLACSVFYLGVAGRMARRQGDAALWASRLCLLMIITFPVFPSGIACFPIFPFIGILCYRKVKRHYGDYCARTADSTVENDGEPFLAESSS